MYYLCSWKKEKAPFHFRERRRISLYTGMLPCFFGGLLWFLLRAISTAFSNNFERVLSSILSLPASRSTALTFSPEMLYILYGMISWFMESRYNSSSASLFLARRYAESLCSISWQVLRNSLVLTSLSTYPLMLSGTLKL